MSGPLDGVKVVEFSEIIAAPMAGMLLADLGAEVIKVEPPWGDPWRFVQSFLPSESRQFMAYNRGKRSLPLDLTRPHAKEILRSLILDTDVVLVNYRPDVVVRLGVDYASLAEVNPGIVYCDLTAYGREGPDSQRPGYDLVLQAMSGMIAAEGKLQQGVPQHLVQPLNRYHLRVLHGLVGMCRAIRPGAYWTRPANRDHASGIGSCVAGYAVPAS
jgi:crotonobetainyl-CoA:carnitine CoA-transferase CaiB-like acyl-CoA transferase